MMYAFNIGQAREDFRAAEKSDPMCTLCYVGEALTDTIDINQPTSNEGEIRGAKAIENGRDAASAGAADERALFLAVASRFEKKKTIKQRYIAYAAALQAYADSHPQDGFGLTQAAYAQWNAVDDLKDKTGALTATGRAMGKDLDAAIVLDPDDIGAHHLRIHFWEIAGHPGRALVDAHYLQDLTYAPGESHLPHMAGHTYSRVGDYSALIASNELATANDDAYFKLGDGPGQTYMHYYHDHDVDFVLYGLSTIGRDSEAREYAAKASSYLQLKLFTRLHANNGVLKITSPANSAARVVAEARLGDIPAAEKDLAALGNAKPVSGVYDIARAALERAKHNDAAAIALLHKFNANVASDPGDPKNNWGFAVGEAEGAMQLESGHFAEAERVFRSELAVYPNDPRLNFGLAEALKAQAKDDTAPRKAATDIWQGDHPLTRADLS